MYKKSKTIQKKQNSVAVKSPQYPRLDLIDIIFIKQRPQTG